MVVLLTVVVGVLAWRTWSLTEQRKDRTADIARLQADLDAAGLQAKDLDVALVAAETKLAQLSTDATGKDAVIKQLQDDNGAKQVRIDALTAERAVLKGCLDGVTLALVQLTNEGSGAAQSTIDGARDQCRQAEVLL
jgi:cell division protein FtsB